MCGSLALDPDVQQTIEAMMADRNWSLNHAVNEAIRHSTLTAAYSAGRTSMAVNKPLSVPVGDGPTAR